MNRATDSDPDRQPLAQGAQPDAAPTAPAPTAPAPAKPARPKLRLDGSLLPGAGGDDPRGWGDRAQEASDYLAERPPHHDR